MYIVQKPEYYSLSGSLKPIIVSSDQEDMSLVIRKGDNVILEEIYSPDADGLITISDLDEIFDSHLEGVFNMDERRDPYVEQNKLSSDFTVQCGSLPVFEVRVLRCAAKSKYAPNLFWESLFLNMQSRNKITHAMSEEFLTVYNNERSIDVIVKLHLLKDGRIETVTKSLEYSVHYVGFFTIDVSPAFILNMYHDLKGCIAYTILYKNHSSITYHLLPANQKAYCFRYRNSFDLPETITANGAFVSMHATTAENVMIRGVETRVNLQPEAVYEFTFSPSHFKSDYALISEMILSREIEFFINDEWIPIIITEEKIEETSVTGDMKECSIKFKVANKRNKRVLL